MATNEHQVEFIITDSQGQTTTVPLKDGVYSLGRNEDCDIRFPQTAKTISRKHAQVTVSGGKVKISDLDSRCGTMVNGQVIREQELENGDVINLANFNIRVSFPEQAKVEKTSHVVASRPDVTREAEVLAGELEAVHEATNRLLHEVARRIVGQVPIVRAVWATILAKGHCLMIGVPGLAKTFMVTTFADALGLQFSRIQFTPDLMPSDIVGSNVIQEDEEGKRHFEFIQGPVFAQLLLADEINRTPPKTQAALLEAMQERQVTVANRSLSLPAPFCVIASQNPIEQEGTYPLPEAQQDRFMLCLVLDYPERDDEVEILLRTTHGRPAEITPVVSFSEILQHQTVVDNIAVSREVAEWAAELVRATRPGRQDARFKELGEMIDWGAGPRAGQALLRAGKALAAMDGRPAVSHDDVRDMALPVLRHRLCCNYRARTQGLTPDDLIRRILERMEPR